MLKPPSTFGSRPSTFPTAAGPLNHSSSNARLSSKKKEYATTTALEQNADALRHTFLAFSKQMRRAEEGSESIGSVLANWPHMFAIIGSFAQKHEATANAMAEAGAEEFDHVDEHPPTPLVRVEVTEAQAQLDSK